MGKLPVDMDILPPSDDRIFKAILTHPDANKVRPRCKTPTDN
jgi:hypothetical protein